MKVALVCDPLTVYGGAERVIEQVLQLYPQADLFTVLDVVPEASRGFLGDRAITTTFLQRLPGLRRVYRHLLSLYPLAVEQLDVTGYDLVISSHFSVAHGVLTRPGQVHVSYVHSPMRYAWDLQHEYLREAGLAAGPLSWLARFMLHRARLWDFAAAQRPDAVAANSRFVAQRIRRCHRRAARVIYPPVATANFRPSPHGRDRAYVSVGRLVPYKRTELVARAFAQMPNRKLVIIGDGPEMAKVAALRAPNIEVRGYGSAAEVRAALGRARAYVFAGIEDFGITAVEAQAAGAPVIAYREGGLAETVLGPEHARPTGLFFAEQTVDAVIAAVNRFEQEEARITAENCVSNAARFSEARFRREFGTFVEDALIRNLAAPSDEPNVADDLLETVP